MIRRALFGDIPRLTELFHEMHRRSRYACVDTPDVPLLKSLFYNSIKKHGGPFEGSTWVTVAEHKGLVVGFIIGILQRFYTVGTKLEATDVFFYANEGANPLDAELLLEGYMQWAESNSNVLRIVPGVTDAIADPERVAKIYGRKGFRRIGILLERVVDVQKVAVAKMEVA